MLHATFTVHRVHGAYLARGVVQRRVGRRWHSEGLSVALACEWSAIYTAREFFVG